MTTSIIEFESHDKILLVMKRNWHHNLFFEECLKQPIMLIKTTLESTDVKRITQGVLEWNCYLNTQIWHKLQIFGGIYWHQEDSRVKLHDLYIFGYTLASVYRVWSRKLILWLPYPHKKHVWRLVYLSTWQKASALG